MLVVEVYDAYELTLHMPIFARVVWPFLVKINAGDLNNRLDTNVPELLLQVHADGRWQISIFSKLS